MRKWLIGGGILLVLLILLVGPGLNWFAERKVTELLADRNLGGDTLQYRNLDVAVWRGAVSLDSIDFYQSITLKDRRHHLRGSLATLRLTGISVWRLVFGDRDYAADRLDLDGLVLDWETESGTAADSLRRDTTGENDRPTVYLGEFHLTASHITKLNPRDEPQVIFDTLELSIADIEIGDTLFTFDPAGFTLARCQLTNDGDPSDFFFENVAWSEGEDLRIGHFKRTPRQARVAFFARLTHKEEWLAVDLADIRVTGLNPGSDFREGAVNVDSLVAGSLAVSVWEVDHLPQDTAKDHKPLIGQLPGRIPFPVNLSYARIENPDIQYGIRTEDGREGKLFFRGGSITTTNFTNEPERLREDPNLRVKFITRLGGASPMTANFAFNQLSATGDFEMDGLLEDYELVDLNPLVEVAADATILDGYFDRMSYQVACRENVVTGEMELTYNDLDAKITEGKFKWAKNFARGLLLKKENPHKGEFRPGKIYHEHRRTKSFFNLYWNAIKAGMMSTALGDLALPQELETNAKKEERRERRAERRESRREG